MSLGVLVVTLVGLTCFGPSAHFMCPFVLSLALLKSHMMDLHKRQESNFPDFLNPSFVLEMTFRAFLVITVFASNILLRSTYLIKIQARNSRIPSYLPFLGLRSLIKCLVVIAIELVIDGQFGLHKGCWFLMSSTLAALSDGCAQAILYSWQDEL